MNFLQLNRCRCAGNHHFNKTVLGPVYGKFHFYLFWLKSLPLASGLLGLIDVLVVVAQLPGELVHNLLEDDRVNVEPEHVEQEPVAHLRLLDDYVDALLLHKPEPDI